MNKPTAPDISDFVDMNEPEVDEEFLRFIKTSIGRIESMNMWDVPYEEFKHIEKRCDQLLADLTEYEDRVRYEFAVFRKFEKRIRKQLDRADQMKFKASLRIPAMWAGDSG